jgi:ribosomal protein S14
MSEVPRYASWSVADDGTDVLSGCCSAESVCGFHRIFGGDVVRSASRCRECGTPDCVSCRAVELARVRLAEVPPVGGGIGYERLTSERGGA